MILEENNEPNVPEALYYTELGRLVTQYVGRIPPAVLQTAMECRAIETLEAIRQVLNHAAFDDPECFERVDALVMTFFQELNVSIDRHQELE